jgi:serine protease Do
MSRGVGFGIGAGAVSVLATVLALVPAVRGDAQKAEGETHETQKSDRKVERKSTPKVDRKVRIVMRGGSYLGVRLQDVDQEDVSRLNLPEEKGALVERVEEDSPAEKAGLEADDVIVRYHGEAVLGATQLARLVAETPAGRTVPVEVVRGGAVKKLSATLGGDRESAWDIGRGAGWEFPIPSPPDPPEMPEALLAPPAPMPPSLPKAWGGHGLFDRMVWLGQGPRKLGLEFQEISGQLADYFKLAGDEGVLVTSVETDGPAAKAGLQAGDVILKLGSREIQDGEDLRRAVEKAEPGRETSVTVQRDGRTLELKLTPAGARRERDRSGTEL